jgi:hypothetical protein
MAAINSLVWTNLRSRGRAFILRLLLRFLARGKRDYGGNQESGAHGAPIELARLSGKLAKAAPNR